MITPFEEFDFSPRPIFSGPLTFPPVYSPTFTIGLGNIRATPPFADDEIFSSENANDRSWWGLPEDSSPLFPLGNPLGWDWEEAKEIFTKKIPLILLSLVLIILGIYFLARSTPEGQTALKLATKI